MSFANTPVDSLLQAAGRKCSGQECENAISLLEEALRIQPGNPALYYQIGFCYSGGCRQHRLVHPALAEHYLRHALAQAGAGAAPLLRANILDTLGNLRGSQVAEIAALEEAIACHREAAELYRRSGRLDDWAREVAVFQDRGGDADWPTIALRVQDLHWPADDRRARLDGLPEAALALADIRPENVPARLADRTFPWNPGDLLRGPVEGCDPPARVDREYTFGDGVQNRGLHLEISVNGHSAPPFTANHPGPEPVPL